MAEVTGTFSYKIPKDKPLPENVGEDRKASGEFTWNKQANDSQAMELLKAKHDGELKDEVPPDEFVWTLRALINTKLYNAAKSNAYQSKILGFKDLKKRTTEAQLVITLREMTRMGIPEDTAREMLRQKG